MYWVKSRPTFTPPAEWTREEDKELLALEKKYYGRWEDVPYELSHTPVECDVRWFELTYPRFCEGSTRTISKKCPKITLLPPKDLELSRNASQLVSKEDNEVGNSVSESDSTRTVAVANSAALEATPGIDAPMTISLRNTWASMFNTSLDDLANDTSIMKLRECEEKVRELRKEKDQLVKQKDLAIKEIHLRRAELGKVRDHVAFLEAAVVRAEEKRRNAEIEVEAKVMEQREAASLLEKQFLLAYIYALEAEFQSSQKYRTMKRPMPWSEKEDDPSSDESSSSDSESDAEDQSEKSTRKQSEAKLAKRNGGGIDFEALKRHGYKGGLSVLKVPPPKEGENRDLTWSTGREKTGDQETEESYKERQKTRDKMADGEELATAITQKEKKSFAQKEKRKRDLGQTSRGKNYVEEEKRMLRDSGVYSGFDS